MTDREIERILQEEPDEEKVAAAVREYRAERFIPGYEDKAAICHALLVTLRLTRDGRDLIALNYRETAGGDEFVDICFNGYTKTANVTADSGTALIRDVLKALA